MNKSQIESSLKEYYENLNLIYKKIKLTVDHGRRQSLYDETLDIEQSIEDLEDDLDDCIFKNTIDDMRI
jgi:hypothetical protein